MSIDLPTIWVKYKRWIILGAVNVLGLIVLATLYAAVTIPTPPDPETSSEKQVVSFLADEKMAYVPKQQRRAYLRKVLRYYSRPQQRERFAQELSRLSDFELTQFRDNVFDVIKTQLAEDGKVYDRLEPEEKRKFIDDKLVELSNIATIIRGGDVRSSNGGKGGAANKVRQRIKRSLPTDAKAAYSMFLDGTNPSDRAKMERYITDGMDRYEELRARERAR